MRRLGWLLVAVLAVAGVVAACGGGAPEREVGSQRPAEQDAGSQRDASTGGASDDAEDGPTGVLGTGDDRRATQSRSLLGSSEGAGAGATARWIDPVAEERAATGRSSSDAAGAGGVSVGEPEVPDGAIRIDVSPMVGGLTFSGPNNIPPVPLPLQLPAGAYNCAVEVRQVSPDDAEGRFVVTFADFDESGSETQVEASDPEWSGAARLEVVESADEDDGEETPVRAFQGIRGSLTGRQLTATIVSDLQDGMWTINCRLVEE